MLGKKVRARIRDGLPTLPEKVAVVPIVIMTGRIGTGMIGVTGVRTRVVSSHLEGLELETCGADRNSRVGCRIYGLLVGQTVR